MSATCPTCDETLVVVTADLFPQHSHADLFVWNEHLSDPAPEPGDEVGWYGMHRAPKQDALHDHVYVPIPVTSWGDYGGDMLGRANWRTLKEEHASEVVFIGHSTHDGYAAALKVGSLITETLRDRLLALEDYPILDEEDLAIVETENEEEALPYLLADFADDENDVDTLTQAYWECRAAEELTFVNEGACSGYIDTALFRGGRDARDDSIRALLHRRAQAGVQA